MILASFLPSVASYIASIIGNVPINFEKFSKEDRYAGGGITDFAMDNFEISKVLNKLNIPHRIVTYEEIDTINPSIPNWIIFFSYPQANMGHWTCLLFYPTKKMLFFDPYGFKPDDQWDFIENPLKFRKPKPYLSKIILPKFQGWKLEINKYDIQNKFINKSKSYIAENLCGELVIMRIIFRDLTSKEFHDYITSAYDTRKIYKIISNLNDGLI